MFIGLVFSFFLASTVCLDDDFGWGMDDDYDEPREIDWDSVRVDDVIILGSGPAGSTAALYLARAGYKPLVLQGGIPGGQLVYTSEIENFPGFKGTGPELVEKIKEQAEAVGARYEFATVSSVNLSVRPFELVTETNTGYKARALIIATGANARYLGIESEQRLRNRGVSACAVCDGALYTGKDVAVVGGGDTAIEEALHLAKMCKSVKLIHRRDQLRASKPMQKKLSESTVEVVWDSVVEEVIGENFVTGLKLKNLKTNTESVMNVDALFLAIGHVPATEVFDGQLERDREGYFVTHGTPATKVPGVFVAGDCADKVFRQAITSAGTGCQAALLAEKFLMESD